MMNIDEATLIIAVISLVISSVLALIKIYETFFVHARWVGHFDWIQHAGTTAVLEFTISNVGSKEGSIRELRFGSKNTPKSEGWMKQSLRQNLPIAIKPGGVSERFLLTAQPNPVQDFDKMIQSGDIAWCAVVDARGRVAWLVVPVRSTSANKAGILDTKE